MAKARFSVASWVSILPAFHGLPIEVIFAQVEGSGSLLMFSFDPSLSNFGGVYFAP